MTEPSPRVLIADDQAGLLEALRLLLKGEGNDVAAATSFPHPVSTATATTACSRRTLDV